ncbi:hypothetical protein OIV83_000778 [Microbotryomycetes sp. JL201]|nr:hypothetical protein OIV83_000778 [Microbotryomycetes sp. JL201]
MAPKAPPSFSSFPDTVKAPQTERKPPSFASFPVAAADTSASTSADAFLDGLEGQIDNRQDSKRDDHGSVRSHKDVGLTRGPAPSSREAPRDTYNERHKSRRSTDYHGDSEDKSRRSKKPRESSSTGDKEIWNELRHDSRTKGMLNTHPRDRRGSFVLNGKSYQLVQYESSKDKSSTLRPEVPDDKATQVGPDVNERKVYYSDKRGDELNIQYGSLHRGSVPKYRRLGAGRVLGLNDGLRITKETAYTGRGVEVAPIRNCQASETRPGRVKSKLTPCDLQTPRYIDSRAARHMINKHVKTIRLQLKPKEPLRPVLGEAVDVDQLLESKDPFTDDSVDPSRFVPFEPEPSVEDKIAALEHEEGQDYRSVAGKVRAEDLAHIKDFESDEGIDDDEFAGLGVSGGESQHELFKRRNTECDRAVRANPKDVRKWIEFADLQDEIARHTFFGTSTTRAFSKAERASTSEIKLSILERALAVEGNAGSEQLILAHLKAAADLWDPARVLQRWSSMLRSNPNLTGLWIEYVSWRQTTASNFSVKGIIDVFAECFEVLTAAMDKEHFRSQKREELEANCLYLFLRMCIMLRQAGFSERATAAFQAIIEVNLLRPNQFVQPPLNRPESEWRREVFEALESFWDSESARIGESGARGWRNTPEDAQPYVGLADERLPREESSVGLSKPLQWARTEHHRSHQNNRPCRTTDPGSEDNDDPYRIVLFEDIRSLLFLVHSPESKTQLAYSFLIYLGLPFIPQDVPTSSPFTTDMFIHSELVERPGLSRRFLPVSDQTRKRFEIVSGEAMEPVRRPLLETPFDTPFRSMPASVDVLFTTRKGWFSALRPRDLEDVDVDMTRNALQMLRTATNDTFLTLDYFAFETCQNPKSAIKVAKQVLRDSRQNLALWDGYARIERQRGKQSEARQVYVTALSMYRSFDAKNQVDGPLLWRAWAEMEWEEGDPAVALRIIIAMMTDVEDLSTFVKEPATPSAGQMLRTRQLLSTELEKAFQPVATQALVRNRNHYAFCAALFEYICRGLQAATEVMDQHVFRLEISQSSGSAEHEEALMNYVKLSFRHSTAGRGFKPEHVRQITERAMTTFKNNTLFSSTFYHNELRMKIQNRFRRSFERIVLSDKPSSENWLFAIYAELHLDVNANNAWAIRNLFDRALEDPATKSSASLWSLYIDFEIRQNELGRAKSLVYRAVHECPWCKPLYMKAFEVALTPVFNDVELRDWYRLMLEKGLRIRTELELDAQSDDQQVHDERMLAWGDDGDDVNMVENADNGERSQVEHDVHVAEDLLREREELKPY